MKRNYLFIVFLALSLVIVGCSKNEDPKKTDPNPVPEVKESFQLVGHYDELAGQGIDFYFLLNLREDGTVTLSSYNAGSMGGYDARDYKENEAFIETHDTGTWTRKKDAEGEDAIAVKTSKGEFFAYETNGKVSLTDLDFNFFGAYTRKATLEGSKEIKYKDYNVFIQAYKQEAPKEA